MCVCIPLYIRACMGVRMRIHVCFFANILKGDDIVDHHVTYIDFFLLCFKLIISDSYSTEGTFYLLWVVYFNTRTCVSPRVYVHVSIIVDMYVHNTSMYT